MIAIDEKLQAPVICQVEGDSEMVTDYLRISPKYKKRGSSSERGTWPTGRCANQRRQIKSLFQIANQPQVRQCHATESYTLVLRTGSRHLSIKLAPL